MCKKERSDMCSTGKYKERGIKELHGFHAEFVVDEEKYIVLAPSQMKHLAVLTEPTTVVVKAIDLACRTQVARMPVDPDPKAFLSHKKVLIAGLGPIGLLAAMVALLRGAEVTGMDVVDPQSLRPRILESMGGKYQKSVKGQKFDLIIDAAGVAKLDFELTQYLAVNGVFALTGVAEEGPPISVEGSKIMHDLVMGNQLILGSVNASAQHFKQAISDLESAAKRWPGVIEQLITSKTPYAQFSQALLKRKPDEIKAIIQWA
jgi:threonine dehydrogenase-like Zn-dependent dehydrogenase